MNSAPGFKEQQLKFDRVKSAYAEKENIVKELLRTRDIKGDYGIFIRAFKREEQLEVWIREKQSEKFSLLLTYPFCSTSGTLGPKRKEGDLQIPEGVYYINHFNPFSIFHLSLGINYPNASDKILSDKQHPGGAIYIHGNCVTIGCIPITDDKIKELYVLAVEAKNAGFENIPVHIFPARKIEELTKSAFWDNLKTIYDDFEANKKLRPIKIDTTGAYKF